MLPTKTIIIAYYPISLLLLFHLQCGLYRAPRVSPIDWTFMSLKVIHWNLIPSIMVLRSGAFGRWSGHKSKVHMNRISVLRKVSPESSLSHLCPVNQEVDPHCQTLNLSMPWYLTSLSPELWETNFCLFVSHPVCVTFVIATITD